ncbi:MAG: hypothetical protein K2Q20_00880, partial [Phycisphaerales bacterium]|nr:hypothetical protein [Phycisphaerales bacterium]
GTSGQQPASLTPIGTSLYYAGRVGGVARAFRLDATSPAAAPVALAPASIPLSNPSNFTLFDGLIYMQATGPSTGAEPHAYNPATDTAFLVADIVPGSNGSQPSNFTALGTELVFLALDAASSGNLNLYAVNPDGVSVTAKTKTSPNVAIGSPAPRQIVRSGNTVYFTTGYLVAFQTQLWAYDGVSAGGWAFVVGPVSGGSFPKALIDVDGKPYFGGIPAAGGPGNELSTVTLDASGVPLAPALAADVEPGAFRSSSPDNLILVNGRIFMSAFTDAAGTELWIYQVPVTAPTSRVCCRGATCSIVPAGDCVVPAGSGVGVRVLDASATTCSSDSLAGCCSADFDKSGDRSVADIFSYLSAWFARSPFARIDGDGTAEPSVADIFGFLTRWFAGCS